MPRPSSSAGRPSRRDWLRLAAAGVAGCSMSGWLERFAAAGARDPRRKRSCILLWMNGGPTTIDPWGLKPRHPNGGPVQEAPPKLPRPQITEDPDRLLKVQDPDPPAGVGAGRADARVRLLDEMEEDFLAGRGGPAALGHRTAYQRAVTLMRSSAVKAFDLDAEPAALRDAYGRNL